MFGSEEVKEEGAWLGQSGRDVLPRDRAWEREERAGKGRGQKGVKARLRPRVKALCGRCLTRHCVACGRETHVVGAREHGAPCECGCRGVFKTRSDG